MRGQTTYNKHERNDVPRTIYEVHPPLDIMQTNGHEEDEYHATVYVSTSVSRLRQLTYANPFRAKLEKARPFARTG